MIRTILVATLILLSFSACKRKKGNGGVKTAGKSDSLGRVAPLKTQWAEWPENFWTAKAKVSLQHPKMNVSFQMSIRCEKNECLWFSAQALGLFEVARGRINKDSMVVFDKINNRCMVGDLSTLENYVPFPMSIGQLQHFLMGRVFWDSLYVDERRVVDDSTFISGSQGDVWYSAAIGKQYFLTRAEAKSEETRAKVLMQNLLFKPIGNTLVAHRKEISSSQLVEGKPENSNIQIEFTRFEFVNKRPEMDLEIPKGCERQVIR